MRQGTLCWLATVLLLPAVVLAQSKPVLFFGSEHVVVDPTSPEGVAYLARLAASRPTPLVPAPLVKAGTTLGSLKVPADLGTHACGDRSDVRLVLCLNEEGRLSYSDTLAALAFASHPTTAYVPDDTVRAYLAAVLAHLPVSPESATVQILTSECTARCTRQITLERRT